MEKIVIQGAKQLNGEIKVQGSKNAALPLIFASLAMRGRSVIDNVPYIGDVGCAVKILSSFGAKVTREGDRLVIDTEDLYFNTPNESLVLAIRASAYLIGACLSRFGMAELMSFGGCNFGNRPIDIHIDSAIALGAVLRDGVLRANKLVGNEIILRKPSVGATINTLIMASQAEGMSIIKGAAREPHVFCLIDFLRSGGAYICERGDDFLVVGKELHGGYARVIPDMIEAGTYLLLSPMLGGCVSVESVVLESLSSYIGALCASGINAFCSKGKLYFDGIPTAPIEIVTEPYPGFPTDLQPQIAPLMAAYFGGELTETVWLDRFGYLSSLSSFGLGYEKADNHARIFRSELKASSTIATDLRGGAACLLCALYTKGQSVIYNADVILRGYSNLCEKLSLLGADIKIF